MLWDLAHAMPIGGYFGRDKTLAKIDQWFFWPNMQKELTRRCKSCRECQRVDERRPPRAPLQVTPIIDTPFDREALNVVGPHTKSSAKYHYILVIISYVTRYPEAIPLRAATALQIAEELLKWISWAGVPREITD